MEIRPITTEECLPLRARVLRPFHPLEDCRYPRDPEAVHFGVFEQGVLVSIVTAHPDQSPLFAEVNQWRIRGMATESALQSKGLGGMALAALLAWGRGQGLPMFWCNAREKAIPFYLRHGFAVQSELFEIGGIGAHKVMRINL